MAQVAVHDEHPAHRHLRMLGADLVFQTPIIGEVARKSGSTLAANPDAERLLASGELAGVWPEGFKGVGKPFSERYKLQRFGRGGFVAAALRTGCPDRAVLDRGGRGDLSDDRQPQDRRPPDRRPLPPGHADLPAPGPLGLIPLPSKWIIEFGAPVDTAALGPAGRRRPDGGLRPHRPGPRDDPADALRPADAAQISLLLTSTSPCWVGRTDSRPEELDRLLGADGGPRAARRVRGRIRLGRSDRHPGWAGPLPGPGRHRRRPEALPQLQRAWHPDGDPRVRVPRLLGAVVGRRADSAGSRPLGAGAASPSTSGSAATTAPERWCTAHRWR